MTRLLAHKAALQPAEVSVAYRVNISVFDLWLNAEAILLKAQAAFKGKRGVQVDRCSWSKHGYVGDRSRGKLAHRRAAKVALESH